MTKAVACCVVLVLALAVTARESQSASDPPQPGGPAATVSPELASVLAKARDDTLVEVIVRLKDQESLDTVGIGKRPERIRRVVERLRAKADTSQRDLRAVLETKRSQGEVARVRPFWIFNGLAVVARAKVVQELAARPEVAEITENTIDVRPTASQATSPESNVALVNAPALWQLGFRGRGVVVANLDTGVDLSHPDLADRWRGGTNSWFDPSGEHPTAPVDLNGHGTWTMGVMVGGDAGGSGVGVAPDARWIAAKIFDDRGNSTVERIHQAYEWLLDPDGNPATPDAPNVVNNSWTYQSVGCHLEFQQDLLNLRAAGIIPVFAAGNAGPTAATALSPADNPEALAVGAVGTDQIYTYSSRGPSACGEPETVYPDLVAPGIDIRTTDIFGGYLTTTGTSIAAPHVAGGLALLLGIYPDLTSAQQESAILGNAVDLGPAGPDNTFGYGRLDISAAYQALAATAPPADFALTAAPSSAGAQQGGSSAAYTVTVTSQNGFADDVDLSLSGLPAGASGAFVPAAVTGGSGSSQLTVSAAASTPSGTYTLTVTGTSARRAHTAQVTLTVSPAQSFTITVSPSSVSALQGAGASATVSVAAQNGFAGNVALTVTGLPSGTSATFTPTTVNWGSSSSKLRVATSATTPAGTFTLTVRGTSGSLVRSRALTLTVLAATTKFPSSATITSGALRTGTVSDLRADDTLFYEVTGAGAPTRTSAWYGSFSSVPNAIGALKIAYKGKNSVSCSQQLAIWNWTSGFWQQLDLRSVGPAQVALVELTPPGALADYISSASGLGTMRVRVRCTASSAFWASGNLMKIVYR